MQDWYFTQKILTWLFHFTLLFHIFIYLLFLHNHCDLLSLASNWTQSRKLGFLKNWKGIINTIQLQNMISLPWQYRHDTKDKCFQHLLESPTNPESENVNYRNYKQFSQLLTSMQWTWNLCLQGFSLLLSPYPSSIMFSRQMLQLFSGSVSSLLSRDREDPAEEAEVDLNEDISSLIKLSTPVMMPWMLRPLSFPRFFVLSSWMYLSACS